MMFNNKPAVLSLAENLDPQLTPTPRRRLTSEPILPARLPSTGQFIFDVLFTRYRLDLKDFSAAKLPRMHLWLS